MSFEQIIYKGKPISSEFDGLGDFVDDSTNTVYYEHIYRSNYDGTSQKHMCLQWSAWCWKQAREHPIEGIKYLIGIRLSK